MRRYLSGLALAVLLTGCAAPPKTEPTPPPGVTDPAPAPNPPVTMPPNRNPDYRPPVIGIFREGVGPGLVVRGYIPEPWFVVRLMKGETDLDSVRVEGKHEFNVAMPAPKETGTEIRIQPGTRVHVSVVTGAVPDEEGVGLFHSWGFSGVRLDVLDKQAMTARISGTTVAREGRLWLEYRGEQGAVLELQEIPVSKAAPEEGTFSLERKLPTGTQQVYFYALEETGEVMLRLVVPVVTR